MGDSGRARRACGPLKARGRSWRRPDAQECLASFVAFGTTVLGTMCTHACASFVCIRCGSWAQKRVARLSRPCMGQPRPQDFGSAVLKRVAAGHHPLTPLRSEGPVAEVVARDAHTIVLTQGVSSTVPGTIRRPTPGGYLDTVIARMRARLQFSCLKSCCVEQGSAIS